MKFKITIIFFVLFLVTGTSAIAQDVKINIIGNAKSVPGEMDITQLRSILKGEKLRWDDGQSIKIALMKTNTPVGAYTCQRIYNMSTNELNKYFLAQVFQGKVKAPTFFTSTVELENYVARTPGAIGVSKDASVIGDDLKLVVVDGRKQL